MMQSQEDQREKSSQPNNWIKLEPEVVNAEPREQGAEYSFVWADNQPRYLLRLSYSPGGCKQSGPIRVHMYAHTNVSLDEIVLGALLSMNEKAIELSYTTKSLVEDSGRISKVTRYLSRRKIPFPSEAREIYSELKIWERADRGASYI